MFELLQTRHQQAETGSGPVGDDGSQQLAGAGEIAGIQRTIGQCVTAVGQIGILSRQHFGACEPVNGGIAVAQMDIGMGEIGMRGECPTGFQQTAGLAKILARDQQLRDQHRGWHQIRGQFDGFMALIKRGLGIGFVQACGIGRQQHRALAAIKRLVHLLLHALQQRERL